MADGFERLSELTERLRQRRAARFTPLPPAELQPTKVIESPPPEPPKETLGDIIWKNTLGFIADTARGLWTLGEVAGESIAKLADAWQHMPDFKDFVAGYADYGGQVASGLVPIYNWRDEKGEWNPGWYLTHRPTYAILDLAVVGQAAGIGVKAAKSIPMVNNLIKASPQVAQSFDLMARATDKIANLPSITARGIIRGTLRTAGVGAQLVGVRQRFAENLVHLDEWIAKKLVATDFQRNLTNAKLRFTRDVEARLNPLAEAASGIGKFKFNPEQQLIVSQLATYAISPTESVQTALRLNDAQFSELLQKLQVLRERMAEFTEDLIQHNVLSRARAEVIAVDVPVRFNRDLRLELQKRHQFTEQELNDFLLLDEPRQMEISMAARAIMRERGMTPFYYPTHLADKERIVAVGHTYLLQKEREALKRIEAEELDPQAIQQIARQVEAIREQRNRWRTSPDRQSIIAEATKVVEDAIGRKELPKTAIEPQNYIESILRSFEEVGGRGYVDPAALTVREFARRTFGYPFHYTVADTIELFTRSMTRHLSNEMWHRWLTDTLVRQGRAFRVSELLDDPARINALVAQNYKVYSPQVYTNLSALTLSANTRFAMAVSHLEKGIQAELQEILTGIAAGTRTVEDLSVAVQKLFGAHSATGIAKTPTAAGLADAIIDLADDVIKFHERIKTADWYLIPDEAAIAVYWYSFPRPTTYDRFMATMRVPEAAYKGMYNVWQTMVLGVPRFLFNNVIGLAIFNALMPLSLRNLKNARRVQAAGQELIKIASERPIRPRPGTTPEAIRDLLTAASDKTFGFFLRLADGLDKLFTQSAVGRILSQDPMVQQLRVLSRKVADHEKLQDVYATISRLDVAQRNSAVIAGELRPVLIQLDKDIGSSTAQLQKELAATLKPHLAKVKKDVLQQIAMRRLKKGVMAQIEAEIGKSIVRLQENLNVALANIETAILDEMRLWWMENPSMSMGEWMQSVQAVWSQMANPKVFDAFLRSTFEGIFPQSREGLAALFANPVYRRIFVNASKRLSLSSQWTLDTVATLLEHYRGAKIPFPFSTIAQNEKSVSIPVRTVKGIVQTRLVDIPPIRLEKYIDGQISIVGRKMLANKLREMVEIAENNPLIFYSIDTSARRRLLDVVLIDAKDRARRIAAIEKALAEANPVLAQAAGMPIEQVFNRTLKTLREWVYFTGNVNPVLRNIFASWLPFHGFYMWSTKYMATLALRSPIHAYLMLRATQIMNELSAKTEEDQLTEGKLYIGYGLSGEPLYIGVGGLDPWSSVVNTIKEIGKGNILGAGAMAIHPFFKAAFTGITGKAIPSFTPVRDTETYLLGGRAYRFDASTGQMVRDAGMGILDKVELFASELARQYPPYELFADLITQYQRQPGKFFWNARPFMRLDSRGQYQPAPITVDHLIGRAAGFTVMTGAELESRKRNFERDKRLLLREMVRRIRWSRSPEDREEARRILQEWQRSGLPLRLR